MRRILISVLCLLPLVVSISLPAILSPENSRSAKRKLDRIGDEEMRPGTSIILTEDEINSYLRYDFADQIPAGLSEPHIRLEPDRVIGTATVDFLEWESRNGSSPGPMLAWLLRGKRPVEAVCRYVSSGGYGQADVESVKIGGVVISGPAVTFLIENLVQPRYPEAVVGRRMPLGYHLKQVRIEQGRAVIVK
jgi:hypothetical protein